MDLDAIWILFFHFMKIKSNGLHLLFRCHKTMGDVWMLSGLLLDSLAFIGELLIVIC